MSRRKKPTGKRDYLKDMRHYVYRHFDQDMRPLYVGCSKDVAARFKQHMFERTWWASQVAKTKITVHPNMAAGLDVERQEIRRLEPLHNAEIHLMETRYWSDKKFLEHGTALAMGHFVETVNPKSALGKLHAEYMRVFQRDLLIELGPVASGYRNQVPDELRPLRQLRLEGPALVSVKE